MFVILGLGNPGAKYSNTRHNIGCMAVERLASLHAARFKNKGNGYVWGSIKDKEVIVAKPLTFMNLSGVAAKGIMEEFSITPDSLIVVCDDSDLPLGKIRIRNSGGSGGHKGLISIIEKIGTLDFPRVRLGIGRPQSPPSPPRPTLRVGSPKGGETGGDLSDYVLSEFLSEEKEVLDDEITRGVSSIEAIITDGIESAMNRFN